MKVNIISKNKNIKNAMLYLFGNLFNKAIALVTIPIFTRILSTSEYGIVNTYASWCSILMVIIGLSLGNSIRNAFVDFNDDLDTYISSIFFLSVLNFIIILLVVIGVGNAIKVSHMPLIILCIIESFGTFIINSFIIKYMMSEEALKRTLLMTVPNFVAAILSIFLILNLTDDKYYGRIVSTCLVNIIFGLFILIISFSKGKKLICKKYWKYALTLSIPLIFHGLSLTILNASDKIIITLLRDTSETGIYSLIHNFGMIAMVITSSLDSMWVPIFTKKMINNDKDGINKFAFKYILALSCVFCGILLIAPEVLKILAPKEYWKGMYIIAPFVLASYFQFLYTLSINVEFYYKNTKVIAKNTMLAAIINIILNFMFIKDFGYIAASYTTLASYFISFLMHYKYVKKIEPKLFPLKIYYLPTMLIVFITVIQYIFIDTYIIRWGILIVAMLSLLIFYIRNSKKIN